MLCACHLARGSVSRGEILAWWCAVFCGVQAALDTYNPGESPTTAPLMLLELINYRLIPFFRSGQGPMPHHPPSWHPSPLPVPTSFAALFRWK